MDIQMGEMSRARCVGRGEEPRGPPHLPPSQYLWVLSNLEALWTLYFGALMEVRYHLINSIFSPSLSSRECEWAENSKLLIVAWSFWWPASFREPTKVTSLEPMEIPITYCLENSKGFRNSVSEILITQKITGVLGSVCQVPKSNTKC